MIHEFDQVFTIKHSNEKDKGRPFKRPLSFSLGTGWKDDVPKQCSTRSAPAKRRNLKNKSKHTVVRKIRKEIQPSNKGIVNYSGLARNLVLAAWPEIVQGLIKKAMSGGYQQARLLLDLSDLSQMDASQIDKQDRQQLCDALLDGMTLTLHPCEGSVPNMENSQAFNNAGVNEDGN